MALCLELSLDKCLVRYNDITEIRIELDNLELHRLADKYIVVTNRFNVDLATRKEGLHTEDVDNHTALRAPFDVAGNDFALLVSLVDTLPSLSCACLLVRQYELTLLVLLALDVDFYLVAYLQVRIVTELGGRNDTVRLVADINNYLALVDGDNRTFYDFIVLDGIQGFVVLVDFFFVFCALLFFLVGIPVEVLERWIFCHSLVETICGCGKDYSACPDGSANCMIKMLNNVLLFLFGSGKG